MYKLALNHHFDSAHNLLDYTGACKNLHGHRWEVNIRIDVHELKAQNGDMLIDFKELKSVINELDHSYLNEKVTFNPTAENIVKYLHEKISEKLTEVGYTEFVLEVDLFESPEACITYKL